MVKHIVADALML